MTRKNALKTLFGLALLVLLFTQVSPVAVWSQMRSLPLLWLIPAGLAFLSIYLFRTWRFQQLLPAGLGFWELFQVVSIQSLANVVLPARLGEVSYLYFLKRKQVPLADSLSSLLLARVFDLVALSCIFFLFLFFFESPPEGSDYLIYAILLFFGVFSTCFLVAVFFKGWLWCCVEKIIVRIPIVNKRSDYLRQAFYAFVMAFSSLANVRHLLQIFAISLCVWGSAYVFGYLCMVKILQLSLSIPETVFAFSFLQLIGLLPIHPFGGVGTVDAAWAFAVMSFGVAKELAISSALTAHVMTYVFSLLLGVVAWGSLLTMWGKLFPQPEEQERGPL